jgi:hypothetical protein
METVHIYHYMPQLKKPKWPKVLGTLCYVDGNETLIVWHWGGSHDRFMMADIYNVHGLSTDDLRVLLRKHWGRTSPAHVLALMLELQFPESELPLLLEGCGYELESVCIRRSQSVFVFRSDDAKTKRQPQTVVLSDICGIVPQHALIEMERLFKLRVKSSIREFTLRDITDYWSALLHILNMIRCTLDGCSFRATASGIGMTWLRHKFLRKKDIACPTHYPTWCDLRDSVFTYPVEVYQRGKLNGEHYYCDANNLYLWSACYRSVPGRPFTHIVLPSYDEARGNIERNVCTAYCQVKWSRYRWLYRGQLTEDDYKNKTVHTWLSGDELKLAWEGGLIRTVYSLYVFDKSASVQEYAAKALEIVQELKRSHDRTYYIVAKFVLLTTLGRFASKGYRTVKIPGSPAPCWWGYEPPANTGTTGFYHVYVMGKVFRIEWGMPTQSSAPQVFAHITANARVRMYTMLDAVAQDNIVYRDVDAVIVNRDGYQQLRDANYISNDPGFLAVKAYGCNCEIFAARHYRVGHRAVEAGIPIDVIVPGVWKETHAICSIPDVELWAVPETGELTPAISDSECPQHSGQDT